MTPEAQRITIAEVCGWRRAKANYYAGMKCEPHWIPVWMLSTRKKLPEDTNQCELRDGEEVATDDSELPDYLNDLNAMHEAEERLLSMGKEDQYYEALTMVCYNARPSPYHYSLFYSIHATAAQRAEAFLRTIGKGEEPTP